MHNASSLKKLAKLLDILNELANTDDYTILNAGKYYLQTQVEDNERINVIFNFIKNNFREQITLEEVSDIANMTVPSFCRYFKKITNKTFTQFVNEYRIIHSQKLLAEQPMSITEICYESGFNNFSYFNRTFKEYTQKVRQNTEKSLVILFRRILLSQKIYNCLFLKELLTLYFNSSFFMCNFKELKIN
jgi:AraC-like DNA-binding protein